MQDSDETSLTLRGETLLSGVSYCENHWATKIGILIQLRIFQIVSPFLSNNNIQLSPEGKVNCGGYYTETRSIEVYIHRSSLTLRGIVVLVFTKSDG